MPPWLVFGAMIRTASMTGAEPGANPQITALDEEGFADMMSDQVVESFARNFMVAIDAWQESGFGAVAKQLSGAAAAREGPAPRHRRQRRSAGAPHGVDRHRAQTRCCRGSPSRPGSIRRARSRGMKLLRTITARSVRHVRVRAGGRARRMGGVRRLRILGRRSGDARRQGALGVPQRLSRRRIARLVDAGADRGGERGRPRQSGRALAPQLVDAFRRARHATAAGAAAEEEVAFAESLCSAAAGHADRRASHVRGRRGARSVPHLAPARGRKSRRAPSPSWRSRARTRSSRAKQVDLIGMAGRERK